MLNSDGSHRSRSSRPLAVRLLSRLNSPTGRILVGMLLGILAGELLGNSTAGFGELGAVLINLVKALAGPLLFFAIVDAFLRTKVEAKSGWLMIAISAANACLAITIGLFLSNLIKPGLAFRSVNAASKPGLASQTSAQVRALRFKEDILGLIPRNLIEPFATNSIVAIVILAVLAGVALRAFKNEQLRSGLGQYRVFEDLSAGAYRALEMILGWVVKLLPVAVFAVVAQQVGQQGFKSLKGVAYYAEIMALGLAIHVLLVYQAWVLLVLRKPLSWFWSGVREPIAFAAGASSSLATLPVTLASLKKMGVSDSSARMAACVGTNLNNDGILLYEAMAALFVAQAAGINLGLSQQLTIAGLCVIAGIGIAGVPEAGLISLSLVLTTAKLPLELLPLLLSVDWILSRCRAMTNVTSDMLVALLLDKLSPPTSVSSGDPKPLVNTVQTP